jgi:hypothetical protein
MTMVENTIESPIIDDQLLQIGCFKCIPLHPTLFHLDVWVCNDQDNLANYFNKRYGASVEYYLNENMPNATCSLTSTIDSELKGIRTIVVNVDSWDMGIIVHELGHVLFHLSKYSGLEIGQESQEWFCYMLEYLFEQCQNDGSFLICV